MSYRFLQVLRPLARRSLRPDPLPRQACLMSWGAFDPKTLTAKQLEQAAKTLSAMSEADLQRMLSSLTPEQKEHMRKNGINPSMIEKVVTTVKEDPATLKRAQDLMKNMSGEQLLDAKRMAEQVSRMADAREREGAGDGASNPREELRAMSKRELRLAAEKLGVADGAVDQFRDDEMAKDEFIELVVSKMPTDPAANAGMQHSCNMHAACMQHTCNIPAAMPDGENLRREVGVSGDHWTRPLQAVTIPVR